MVTVNKLKKVTAVAIVALLATSITFISIIGISQIYGTNIFFDDDTEYDFKVVSEIANVTIRTDGAIDIEYWITFRAYLPIPIVDIGFPNHYYDLSSVQADLDGIPITDIRRSEYLMVGVEIHLGTNKIQSGATKTLHVKATNPIMVFRDDITPFTMASVDFSPTWFDSYICNSVDYLEVNIHFPKGFTDGYSVRYHYTEPTFYYNATNLIFNWNWTNAKSEQYNVGVSYPIQAAGVVLDSWLYWLFSPIQKVVFIVIIVIITIIALIGTYFIYRKYRKNAKQKYLKPSVKIECLGIKRGLTVPEAAILIGIRLDRVVSLIIFGLIRKGAIDVVTAKPLLLDKKEEPPELHPYEKNFLKDCLEGQKMTYRVKDSALKKFMVDFIKDVNKKMEGYSRKDTELYYKRIMNNAFEQIKQSGIKEFDEKTLSENFEWLLLDPDEKRMDKEFKGREVYVPYWYYHYHYYYIFRRPYPIYAGRMPRVPLRLNGFEFANNVVKNLETFSNSVVKNLSTFSNSVLNTIFPPASSSWGGGMRGSSSGGGGSCICACACACAGCACA
ncbi:MAG: hypothetical protein EAX96_18640 [Candidatus Lokiarchaeota archaeon]|nr:hypothetical protein [Candidatus Lokiarchaeota archaeon]